MERGEQNVCVPEPAIEGVTLLTARARVVRY
jgi:hypothetical protein